MTGTLNCLTSLPVLVLTRKRVAVYDDPILPENGPPPRTCAEDGNRGSRCTLTSQKGQVDSSGYKTADSSGRVDAVMVMTVLASYDALACLAFIATGESAGEGIAKDDSIS